MAFQAWSQVSLTHSSASSSTARIRRAMRKVRTLSDYEAAAAELFETRPLRENPGFTSLKEESAWS